MALEREEGWGADKEREREREREREIGDARGLLRRETVQINRAMHEWGRGRGEGQYEIACFTVCFSDPVKRLSAIHVVAHLES